MEVFLLLAGFILRQTNLLHSSKKDPYSIGTKVQEGKGTLDSDDWKVSTGVVHDNSVVYPVYIEKLARTEIWIPF